MRWLNRLLGRQEPWEDPWDDHPRGLVLKGGMTPPNPPPPPVAQAAPPLPPENINYAPLPDKAERNRQSELHSVSAEKVQRAMGNVGPDGRSFRALPEDGEGELLAIEIYDDFDGWYTWFVIPANGRVKRRRDGDKQGRPEYDQYMATGIAHSEREAHGEAQSAADKITANGHGNPTQRWVQER